MVGEPAIIRDSVIILRVNIQTNVTVHEILFITFPVRSPDAKLENVVVPRPYFL